MTTPRLIIPLIITAIISILSISAVHAGLVLDDILNSMQIDQQTPPRTGDDHKLITKDRPLGQTFITGDSVEHLCRIAFIIPFWHQDWQVDESLVLTLWDSPDKKVCQGRFDIPYSRRQWDQGIMMFSVETRVKPNTGYYFEFNVEGGDGKILGPLACKGDYTGGQAYEGGKPAGYDLWFETHVKKTTDRDRNYEEFFGNFNLDHPGLEKVKDAVAQKDWDSACREFLTYFESKKELFNDEDATPKPDPACDTREADLVSQQKWPAQDGSIVDLGPNWNYFATWPTLGGVGLTRTGLMKPLAFTYTRTGNDKYARAWNDMLINMFRNVPCPLKSGIIKGDDRIRPTIPAGISGCLWDSISLAARLHHETFYNRFRKSPLFEPDVRMAWWANLTDMVNTLERMDAGGNWTTQNTSSLFSFAQKYPEYKNSKKWFSQGFEGIKANLLENMYPDGPCREATTGYHCFSLGMFFSSVKRARELGLDVSKECMDRLEKAFEYTAYTTQPDWQMPIWGDTNRPNEPCGLIELGARYFNRPDLLWVGTKGKEGKKPERTSAAFTTAGYYVMRSGWDSQARFLVTRNGFSNSHYHSDNLAIILNAYGTDLLPDPGVYTYGTPECNELVKTKSHSTISVDNKDIKAGNGESKWYTTPVFDCFDGTSPGYQDLSDVLHKRMILFIKPDYWVVGDIVSGSGDHIATQLWHYPPVKVDLDQTSGTATTTSVSGGNIEVIPLMKEGRRDRLYKDVYAVNWTEVSKSPVAAYERTGPLPLTFCTVLYPFPRGRSADIQVRELKCSEKGAAFGAVINREDNRDYAVFSTAKTETEITPGGLRIAAASGLVRMSGKSGKVTAFGWSDGRKLALGKTVLATSDDVISSLSVSYSGDTVKVDVEGTSPSLRIATLGAKKAVVNGKELRFTKKTAEFSPFNGK